MHFVVGVDGSEASQHAFNLAASFWKSRDSITIVHICDPAKDQAALPYGLRSASIEDYYRTRCPSRFPAGAWRFLCLLKSPGRDAKGELVAFLNDPTTNADLLVVGMVGRKGPKEVPHLIGRTSDYSLREAHVSSCVSKLRDEPAESVFACAVDGSDHAHLGVELTEHLARPSDRVVVLHIEARAA
jgi:nucleotide-binding universal stress UspA family protein